MMRLFVTEFEEALNARAQGTGVRGQETGVARAQGTGVRGQETGVARAQGTGDGGDVAFSIVTGVAACKYLTNLLKMFTKKCGKIRGKVCAVSNEFFGDSVTVSGLVTGSDIIAQLGGRSLGSLILIPRNMLRDGDDVFLDGVTVSGLSGALGVPVRVVGQDGAELFRALRAICALRS